MPLIVDKEEDSVEFSLLTAEVTMRKVVAEGIEAHYDPKGRVVGIKIWHASKRKNNPLSPHDESLEEVRQAKKGTLTKQQHYVWAFHLRSWADEDGKICCIWMDTTKFARPTSDSIAKELFFYRTHRLLEGDLEYLYWLIEQASIPGLKELNMDTLSFFQQVYDVQQLIGEMKISEKLEIILDEHLDFAEKMFGERYHAAIEEQAKPILEQLRRADLNSLDEPDLFNRFVFYLAQQLFRTNKMRKTIARTFKHSPIRGHDASRTAHIEQQIFANNIAVGIMSQSNLYKVSFLKNETKVPFITGDQPVINLRVKESDHMKLYYPLSPSLAIMLHADQYQPKERHVSFLEVETLNYRLMDACENQIYSDNAVYLKNLFDSRGADMESIGARQASRREAFDQ